MSTKNTRVQTPIAANFGELLILASWCGLMSGLLEVATIIFRKRTFDINHLYWMPRHFVWLIPLVNLAIFLAAVPVVAMLFWFAGPRGRWLAPRALIALALLPPIWAASPRIYAIAGLLLAIGLATRAAPALENRVFLMKRVVRLTLPIAAVSVILLALSAVAGDWLGRSRERARPLPPTGSPNLLLIVLDTVAAGHLSLHGYHRPTSPALEELAGQGIRFERARASSSWTLPSHASMFTGRWPHELSAGWFTPLDRAQPTLAEFLGERGYATAGFIANYWYCSSDSGLARGFVTYHDYPLSRFSSLRTAGLVDRTLGGMSALTEFARDWLGIDVLVPSLEQLSPMLANDRKDAAAVNREFLAWLSTRPQPERPFFAFLNYFDAHYPYELPETGIHRFGVRPRDERERSVIRDWLTLIQHEPTPFQVAFGRDAYDDCIAQLDEEIGRLMDELDRGAIRQNTWVIVTADHGESFGERPGVFWHGTSLYDSQLRVPLLIVPPRGGLAPRVVSAAASLRDLPATIADVLGYGANAPFGGRSLARFWREGEKPAQMAAATEPTLSEVVPLGSFGPDPSQWSRRRRWPLGSVTDGDWTYIRREGEIQEELYRADTSAARDQPNLAADQTLRPILDRLREQLGQLTRGPLTPERFNP
jgi:arylsulfatase A-like enzyme